MRHNDCHRRDTGLRRRCRERAPRLGLARRPPAATSLTLVAKGTGPWSLKVSKLPKGTYAVTLTVIDAGGNTTTKTAGRISVR